jgi:Zn-dependent M28 family amino/carboxypeptidase
VRLFSPMKILKTRWFWVLFIIIAGLTALSILITQPVFHVARKTVPHVSPERLQTHVRELATTYSPRDWTDPENLDRAAAYISNEFKSAGARVEEQKFVVDSQNYKNIIASFGPETSERVIVGAHYDTCGGRPGADDNASGIAGLIELAHLLGKSKLNTRVDLVAYTLEEPPFFRTEQMGSAVHAASLKEKNVPVRAMICLEMIGFFTDNSDSQAYPIFALRALYPDRANFIALVGTFDDVKLVRRVKRAMLSANDLPMRSINAPRSLTGVDFSDHLNYWKQDYPAVMVSDTAFYRNRRYHERDDTPDTLDYAKMAQVVEQVYAGVVDLAE